MPANPPSFPPFRLDPDNACLWRGTNRGEVVRATGGDEPEPEGKKTEALQMLAEIYGWFTEGFDTADLQEAKMLLEELEGYSTAAYS